MVDGNLNGFPNEDEFDITFNGNYEETDTGTSSFEYALVNSLTAKEWMNRLGKDWELCYDNFISYTTSDPYAVVTGVSCTAENPSVDVTYR